MNAAKQERSRANRILMRKMKEVNNAINKKAEVALITWRFDECKELWKVVQEKHDNVIDLIDIADENAITAEEAWLEEVQTIFFEFEQKKCNYQVEKERERQLQITEQQKQDTEKLNKDQESRRKELEKEAVQRDKEIKEQLFRQSAKHFEELLAVESQKQEPVFSVIMDTQEELKLKFNQFKDSQTKYLTQVDNLALATAIQSSVDIEKTFLNLSQLSGSLLQKNVSMKKPDQDKSNHSNSIKLERMRMPTFNGNIREYPRFRSDFRSQVLPQLDSSSGAAYALKSCLSSTPHEVVRNIDNDIDEMWRRLDEKYGRTEKLTEAIMLEIKRVRPIKEGEEQRFVQFVEIIEKGYRDLQQMKVEYELSNTTVISLLEEKLPKNIKREWSKEITQENLQTNEQTRFQIFMKFLLEQKRIIEYEYASIRLGTLNLSGRTYHLHDDTIDRSYRDDNIEEGYEQEIPQSFRCLIHNSNNHSTSHCRVYQEMPLEERINILKSKGACWSCLKRGHRSSTCRQRKRCTVDIDCKKYHHESLHGGTATGNAYFTDSLSDQQLIGENPKKASTCLLQLMTVKSATKPSVKLNTLWDGGATISLITFSKARQMGLTGDPVKLSVIKVGGEKQEISSYIYELPIFDETGKVVLFQVYGIDKISTDVSRNDIGKVKHLFSNLKQEEVERPSGEIDVLVGFEYAGFHPVKEQSIGHLLLLSNRFGRCLGGSHPMLEENTKKIIQNVQILFCKKVNVEDFFETENLGIECSPRCGSCKCGKCPIGGKQYTLKEERELKLIQNGLTHNDDYWEAQYPWVKDPVDLPDNRNVAYSILKSTERRLSLNPGHAAVYCAQIQDMVDRGVARKLTKRETHSYEGPVHYLSHHEVLKPESSSTPCRIVFNSSANYKGHVLNEYWAKGPDLINNLLGVLLRFREQKIAITGDIKKMYHAIKISELDQHTHRFLWRNMDLGREPDTYIITSVSFGDRPAGNIAMTALKMTAELKSSEYPDAAEMIIKNSYVDDIVDSVPNMDIAKRMMSDADKILKFGGFAIKHWTTSGTFTNANKDESSISTSERKTVIEDQFQTFQPQKLDFLSTDSPKVLGVHWNQTDDNFKFKVKVNFSPRKRKVHTGPNLLQDQIPQCLPTILTKRLILSQVNGIYDPLGFATPFTVKAKILMRELWMGKSKQLGWDDDIPYESKQKWADLFHEMFDMESIQFERCIKPSEDAFNPMLIMFSDASEKAFGTCAYIRWELPGGKYVAKLVAAKGKVAPIKQISIVRLELNAALLAKRLAIFIKEETRINFAKELFFVDSEIVRAMLQRESYGFNTFVAVRIGEIQSATDPKSWRWIEGKENIADWTTRGISPSELHHTSIWQNGPQFLKFPEEQWPVKNTFNSTIPLPEQANVVLKVVIPNSDSLANRIDITKYSSFKRLLRVTARVLSMFRKPISFKNACLQPKAEDLEEAEIFWVKEAQKNLHLTYKRDYPTLNPYVREDGITVVSGRTEKFMAISLDKKDLPLIPRQHSFANLYAQYAHEQGHLGVSATVSKIRARYWIIGVSHIAKEIRYKCVTCKRIDKRFAEQKMKSLPIERLKPAPPWYYTSLDMFGPYITRGEVNKRSRGKVYGIIFDCAVSRAIHLEVTTDYSTESFLQSFRRFVSIRGYPKKIYSDCGSQLVAANKELQIEGKSLDLEQLRSFGVENGLTWEFSTPNGPWRNGCSEALIKSVKRVLKYAIGDQVLSVTELQTVFFEVANIVNERPIGRHPTNPDDGTYLSPNHLLLGRASNRVPSGPFNLHASYKSRFLLIQQITDSFWKRWLRDYFPSLLVEKKWHTEKRNVHVGDVVLVQDSNQIRGSWKLATVSKVFTGDDQLVRRVEVKYKNVVNTDRKIHNRERTYVTVERPVQRLIVVVPVNGDDL